MVQSRQPHRSAIGWCDFSGGNANFVTGCTPVSEGCKNCYARYIYKRYGHDFSVQWYEEKLERLAQCVFPGPYKHPDSDRPLVFVCDTGDLFHEKVPEDLIVRAFDMMRDRRDVDWQVLTKRAERMHDFCLRYYQDRALSRSDFPNLWLGVSAENQRRAEERIQLLLDTRAAIRWVSVEPMLGPVDLTFPIDAMWDDGTEMQAVEALDWVVCGAESGDSRRPFNKDWAVQLLAQCRKAHVPFFFKQGSHRFQGRDDELPGIGEVKEWPV